MSNERLRDALYAKGLTPHDLAHTIGVDPKTVERWITSGRSPYARFRHKVAQHLDQTEHYLWPDSVKGNRKVVTSQSEIVHIYPRRNVVPSEVWRRLFDQASERIEIVAFGGIFPFDHDPSLIDNLKRKAEAGAKVRLMIGNPDSDAVALRGAEEGIGNAMAARANNILAHFMALDDTPNVGIRMHATTLYTSIYRFDSEMLVNMHAYGSPAALNPVMHLRVLGGGTMFDLYAQSFERIWASAIQASKEDA